MAQRKPGPWSDSTALARAILHDRIERRKWLGRMVLVPLLMLATGLWLIDGWLMASPLRFLIWWGVCAAATCVVIIFALYDALAVIREERTKHK
jgi:hypothetical protein